MSFLYQKEFIAVLIDFYLEKRSPIPYFSEKKHSLGNRYVEPEFNSLIQTVAIMVRRSRITTKTGSLPPTSMADKGVPTYELSENDVKCVMCSAFYEKTLKEKYDYTSTGTIIKHFCFENDALTYNLANIILNGINRCGSDDIQSYLEAMSYLFSLNDFLIINRMEWILGFAQPMQTTAKYGSDSFGLYGNYSLDELVVNYESPLNIMGCTSLINFMLQNRKKNENTVMACLKQLLLLSNINDNLFRYLLGLPPPSVNYAKFTDWIPAFIEYYLGECKKYYYYTQSKEDMAHEGLKIWESLEKKIQNNLIIHQRDLRQALYDHDVERSEELSSTNATEADNVENTTSEKKEGTVLKGFFDNYIIGKTYKMEDIDKTYYSQPDDPYEITVKTKEVYCYITESKPTGESNLAFPNYILDGCTLKSYEVKSESPLSLFIQPRGMLSSLDSNKNIQYTLQNEIEAALAQASESTQSNTSGGSPNLHHR